MKIFFNVQFMSNIRMDTGADLQGHTCTLCQRLCGFLRRRWTRMDAFPSWPMMMRASEPPMKSRRSELFQFLLGFPDMASSVGSRIAIKIAGDAARLRHQTMVSCVDVPGEHEQVGDQCCPEPIFISDLAAQPRLDDEPGE